jgi:hypothetical protein
MREVTFVVGWIFEEAKAPLMIVWARGEKSLPWDASETMELKSVIWDRGSCVPRLIK